jgi:prevent-host-death family protein
MGKDDVSVRDVRNHGREVLERVIAGERLTVTRAGRPVAELRPLPRAPLPLHEILARRRHLPRVDADALKRDLDAVIDMEL